MGTEIRREIKIKFIGFYKGFGQQDPFYEKVMQTLGEIGDVVLTDEPDYLFCSCFSDEWVDYDCIRIFYTGENLCPDFNSFDYAIGSDILSFDDRYLKYNHYHMHPDECTQMAQKHLHADEIFHQKREFCSFVVSKPSGITASSAREEMFYALSKYKKVNSGGRYLNNIGLPNGIENKNEFQRKHKFAICFENSSHPGYSTEKIVQAFATGTIPIYWGDPKIGDIFNENAFINCCRFSDISTAVERVKEIDNNNEKYLSMLKEPALKDISFLEKKENQLREFLRNIVLQPKEEAFRRNRIISSLESEVLIRKNRINQRKLSWRLWNKWDQMMNRRIKR